LEIGRILVVVWNEVIIKIKWKILFRNLIFHDHGVWDLFDDGGSYPLKELLVLGFIMSRIPMVLLAILAGFNHENNL
jgi:hypothetical protein